MTTQATKSRRLETKHGKQALFNKKSEKIETNTSESYKKQK